MDSYICIKGSQRSKLDIGELFVQDLNTKANRLHFLKPEKLGCVRDRRMYLFSHRVVGRWNALDQHTMDDASIVSVSLLSMPSRENKIS